MKTRLMAPVLVALLALTASAPVRADTLYGCTDLDARQRYASVEGDAGLFFRIQPDLVMAPVFADETVIRMADLSQALAARGTRLIFVPLPGRALALPGALPPLARDLGFDPAIAATLHDDVLVRLAERGVAAVNARTALRSTPAAPTFFGADPRITSAGAQALARAIGAVITADASLAALPRGSFTSQPTGPVTLASPMRAALQRHCRLTLPAVTTDGFVTTGAATGAADTALMGAGGPVARIALLGTLEALDPALNLAGFLSETTGLPVQAYGVGWGEDPGAAFAAISTYLTSDAFGTSPPAIIVWVVPLAAPLADQGDGPLRELAAAARGQCTQVLAASPGPDGASLTIPLAGLDPAAPGMLLVETGSLALQAEFAFTGPDGTTRSRWVTRHPDQIATGRFYVALDGLWPQGASSVTVRLRTAAGPTPPGLTPRAALCPEGTR